MGHNSKIGYPYLPAGDGTSYTELGGRRWREWPATLTLVGTAGGNGRRLWHSQKELGGQLWQGRRTTANDPGGDGGRLTGTGCRLAGTAGPGGDGDIWRTTPAGTADDPGGDADDSGGDVGSRKKSLAGRLWQGTGRRLWDGTC
eukprot:s223_g10.t1